MDRYQSRQEPLAAPPTEQRPPQDEESPAAEACERSGVTGWALHDLRRTFSTRLHDLSIAPHVVEQVFNRQSHRRQVGGTYNKSLYEREVRNALTIWEDYVCSLVTGGK